MKNLFVLTVLFCCLAAAPACKKEKPAVTPVLNECLEDKFEEFKQLPGATKIVKINHPDGSLYWLIQGAMVDEGEPILNEQCELVCTEDCECFGNIVLCNGAYMNFPMETIWEQ